MGMGMLYGCAPSEMEVNLGYAAEEAPPLSIFATAAVVGVSLKADPNLPLGLPPMFLFPSGEQLHGTGVLLRYLGRIATLPDFYNRDALATAQALGRDGKISAN